MDGPAFEIPKALTLGAVLLRKRSKNVATSWDGTKFGKQEADLHGLMDYRLSRMCFSFFSTYSDTKAN